MANIKAMELLEKIIPGGAFNLTSVIDTMTKDDTYTSLMSNISSVAAVLGFGIVVLQIVKIFIDGMRGQDALRKGLATFIMAVIITVFIKSVAYSFFMRYVMVVPAQSVAMVVKNAYWNNYVTMISNAFEKLSDKNFFALTASIGSSLITTVLCAAFFILTTIISLIIPCLQQILFKLVYIVGPVCMVFALSDYTKQIAQKWLGLTMAICWFGFFAACAQFIGNSIMSEMLGEVANPITTLIYALIALLLQLGSFTIATFIFGAAGSGLNNFSNPASVGRSVQTAAAGAAGAVAGVAMASGMSGMVAGGASTMMGKAMTWGGGQIQKMGGTSGVAGTIAGGLNSSGMRMSNVGDFVSGKSKNLTNWGKTVRSPQEGGPTSGGGSMGATKSKSDTGGKS